MSRQEASTFQFIKNLPYNKAPGYDKATARVLKDSSPVTVQIITNLINGSFSHNTFPNDWKMADVIPIQKSGDYEDPANTRPVSLLPIVSKVCERSALSQFRDFLDSNGIIHHSQSGNRKLHSTETALLHYTDELLKNMDAKKISVIVLLDMSKAFDSIRHGLLINKLHKLGVSFAACSWFLSYLSQRMQVVKIEDSLSEPLPLKAGIPQGSILGPVLFTLYVKDPSMYVCIFSGSLNAVEHWVTWMTQKFLWHFLLVNFRKLWLLLTKTSEIYPVGAALTLY